MMLLTLSLVISAVVAFGDARGVFYVFTGDGIQILDPTNMRITNTIPYNTNLPTGEGIMCTPNRYKRTKCSWAGTVNVGGEYIYAADSSGNRLIVIDAKRQVPVKAIKTNGFPYQVKYFAALDEVWVVCWRNNILNVVGGRNGVTQVHKISDASSMKVLHSIQAQNIKTYKYLIHGFLEAENCQNVDPNLKYGVVSHYREAGIHKIDLVGKTHYKFINTSSYGCRATLGLAYSSVKKYAFVQCLGKLVGNRKRKMLVIDVEKEKVIHAGDAITNQATGYPYASPDGKFVTVLNSDKIITYYLDSKMARIVRLPDVQLTNFWPSKIAFVKTSSGYLAYVTSKNTDTILTIELNKRKLGHGALKTWFIQGVGYAVGRSSHLSNEMTKSYKKAYLQILRKTGMSYMEKMFQQYLRQMSMQHIVRRISTGCGTNDQYVVSPSVASSQIVLIDGKTHTMIGKVNGVASARSAVWVEV